MTTRKRGNRDAETYGWMGPRVSKASALDNSEALRERITAHQRIMLLNDEAHHVWDPDSAWNEAITFLAETTRKKGGRLVAQLDFSATPRDDKGNVFRHVVCDTPLGEAVDAGIVKSPIIGHGERLVERTHEDAAYKFENHLTLGYRRWLASKEEWEKSEKKALLFVMTDSTDAADAIARRLNTDPIFSELNGKTINLHTNLKGKVQKRGRGQDTFAEFVESEKDISDEDLKELRKLSRELDNSTSPYRCIVSVLMLREGWDVRNVTTIVPLRPLSAASRILPEQTLGRGLRRMTPPGEVAEVVTVVEHKSFSELYRDELSQEGLPIEVVDIDDIPRTTVTIYPDAVNKDLEVLALFVPRLTSGYRIDPELAELTFQEVREAFVGAGFQRLPLGTPAETEVKYEGRHLITDEVVEQMSIKLPLLADGVGAISFFREELERTIRIRGQHAMLAPIIQQFLEEVLFKERVTLYDQRLVARLADPDVREHIRATFVPILLSRITQKEQRLKESEPISVCSWTPFQVTHSERRPTRPAKKTPFNLVACSNQLEVAMTQFADLGTDVTAFAKNAGPQALRIDYLNTAGRRSIYTPDFLIRMTDGTYFLVETKGRADSDVAAKARAAIEWCKAASRQKTKWQYLFVPQEVFEQVGGNSVETLARACAPALADLLRQATDAGQFTLPFGKPDEQRIAQQLEEFIEHRVFGALPSRYQKAIEHAVALFNFHKNKEAVSFAPVFQPLLGPIDHSAEALLRARLAHLVPADSASQQDFFEPDFSAANKNKLPFLRTQAGLLKKLLVHQSPLMPTGLLCFCLGYATSDDAALPGVFAVVRSQFAAFASSPLRNELEQCYNFRNRYIAHQKEEKELNDFEEARTALHTWCVALSSLHQAVLASASISTP